MNVIVEKRLYCMDHARRYHVRTEITQEIINIVERQRGVEFCTEAKHGRYRLDVYKATAFSWDEVEPGILEILNALP